jgi:hypothetical protein
MSDDFTAHWAAGGWYPWRWLGGLIDQPGNKKNETPVTGASFGNEKKT